MTARRARSAPAAQSRLRVFVTGADRSLAAKLRRAARAAARSEFLPHDQRAGGKQTPRRGLFSGELSIAVVGDDGMAAHNEHWLQHPGPTDVLTFDLGGDPAAGRIDGEIIVSRDTARREALRRGHSGHDELCLYAVHGVLHLLGHGDAGPRERRRMHELEDEILTELGIGAVYRRRDRRAGTRR